MKQHYVSIAAASLAALVVGIGPATAQTSSGQSPSTPLTDTAQNSTTCNTDDSSQARSASSGALSSSVTTTDAISGATNDNANVNIDCQSPSASPPMGDDKVRSDEGDRGKMKDQEQLDKKNGLDRG